MMGLPDGPKSFRIGLVVLIQYRLWQTASHPPSHVAVAITLNAKASSLKRARCTWKVAVKAMCMFSDLLHAAYTWTIKKHDERGLLVFEMPRYQIMLLTFAGSRKSTAASDSSWAAGNLTWTLPATISCCSIMSAGCVIYYWRTHCLATQKGTRYRTTTRGMDGQHRRVDRAEH